MTNEERARAIRRTWGLNIALAASASKNDLGEACDGLEAAILSALDAATAPLVAERERLIARAAELSFAEVTRENIARCNRWHKNGITDWSPERWAVAMQGEAGEVCNALKKLFRIEDEIANINDPDRQISTREGAIAKIGEEIADTFLYLNLLACRLGISLEAEVIAKFNSTSEKYGFPERLPALAEKEPG